MAFSYRALAASSLLLCLSDTGCADPVPSEAASSSADAITVANGEYADVVRDAERLQRQCEEEGNCASNTLRPEGIRPLSGPARASNTRAASSFSMCEALEPFRAFGHPYFFAGASATAAGIAMAMGGVDIVFDLKMRQAALFHYKAKGIQNLVGAEANVYVGWAFGDKEGVNDAWSGKFQTAEATATIPVLKIGAGGFIFRSPDNSVWGGALEASFGLNLIATPVEVSVSEGEWTSWDKATRWYGQGLWFVRYEEATSPHHGKAHPYLQFRGTRDIVLALLQTFGLTGAPAAAQAAALAALDKAGLTLEKACPKPHDEAEDETDSENATE